MSTASTMEQWCVGCDTTGHTFITCSLPRNDIKTLPTSTSNRKPASFHRDVAHIICKFCGEAGHAEGKCVSEHHVRNLNIKLEY